MENGMEYLILGDMLLDAVVRACHMKWDDNEMLYRDTNNQLMDWDDFISYAISIDDIIQVNIWGDGTIEFQITDGESINWYDFDKSVLVKVINILQSVK